MQNRRLIQAILPYLFRPGRVKQWRLEDAELYFEKPRQRVQKFIAVIPHPGFGEGVCNE
jgi:hypothetical protein